MNKLPIQGARKTGEIKYKKQKTGINRSKRIK